MPGFKASCASGCIVVFGNGLLIPKMAHAKYASFKTDTMLTKAKTKWPG
jgi:hypothetical protein